MNNVKIPFKCAIQYNLSDMIVTKAFFYHIHFVLPFSNSGYCVDEHIQNKKIMKYI